MTDKLSGYKICECGWCGLGREKVIIEVPNEAKEDSDMGHTWNGITYKALEELRFAIKKAQTIENLKKVLTMLIDKLPHDPEHD